jgi:hypothetical protein
VLVPPRDDLADTELRVREILTVLTTVERRAAEEIADDINAPFADIQLYRTFSDGLPDGATSLLSGLRGLQGVRDLVCAAARTVIEGPLPTFPGGTPRAVSELLQQVQLAPSRSGSHTFTVRVPLDGLPRSAPADGSQPRSDAPPLGRQVALQLYEAITAAHTATMQETERGLTAFDHTVTAGVSANLCEALSGLAGRQRQQPFDITFRWGRGLVSGLEDSTIGFRAGTGKVMQAAARHLRQLSVSGTVTITGLVESLHDQPRGTDRWRIKVRGDSVEPGGRIGRTMWVRLDGQAPYDRAIAAHRARQRVRARGVLSISHGRLELIVEQERFDLLG